MAAASSDEGGGGGGFPPMTQYSSSSSSSSSTMYHYLSVLNDKINELQSLVGVIASPNRHHSSIPCSSYSMAISTMTSTIQDIILASSSFRLTFQQHINSYNNPPSSGTIIATSTCNNQQLELHPHHHHQSYDYNNSNIIRGGTSSVANHEPAQEEDEEEEETLHWFSEPYNNNNSTVIYCDDDNNNTKDEDGGEEETDIIELDAADLLASYTHFCQICGKGFKREANLRMHMRAHGDEFKTSEALKNNKNNKKMMITKKKKYSCPEDGCRWNKNHAKFQALKSMVCVKNHYKRSHCPKMYVCKRCNNKNFSLLSDLRTHEKHCGDPNKWLCSCGTTFSRKDKLFGHLALFLGHSPVHAATQPS